MFSHSLFHAWQLLTKFCLCAFEQRTIASDDLHGVECDACAQQAPAIYCTRQLLLGHCSARHSTGSYGHCHISSSLQSSSKARAGSAIWRRLSTPSLLGVITRSVARM